MPMTSLYHLICVVFITTSMFVTTGCIKRYAPPSAEQPHAVLKLRRTYASLSGTYLREQFIIQQEYNLFTNTTAARAAENALIDGVLIHPEPTEIQATSHFFHHEQRMVQESYQEQQPYMDTETYNCGTAGAYRTCTRSVTRYRSVTKYRTVLKTVEVTDAGCSDTIAFQAGNGDTFLLEMTFQGHGSCTLSCFKQSPNPDGTFSNAPCPSITVLQSGAQ